MLIVLRGMIDTIRVVHSKDRIRNGTCAGKPQQADEVAIVRHNTTMIMAAHPKIK